MNPAQLAQQLRIKPEVLATICSRLQITRPEGPDGTFSSEQTRRICDFVDAQRRAQAQKAERQELGGQSYGDVESRGPSQKKPLLSQAIGDAPEVLASSQPPDGMSIGDNVTTAPPSPKPAPQPTPTPPPVSGLAASIAVLPLELGFEVIKILGEGGMGSVLLARERSSGREVAIKRLKWGGASEEALDSMITEFRNGCSLSHLHIVRFLTVNRDDAGPYFTMEYVDGESLAQRLKRGPLDLPTALDIFTPLADALQHAHDQQKVHRDLKPANILLTKGGMPKLADFGLAMTAQEKGEGSDFVGTLDFMPPEQRVDSRHCTAASDQWSFAATLYYALTKLPPRDYDPAKVPAAIRPILTQALQDAPNKRFKSMAEMVKTLARCSQLLQKAQAEPEFVPEATTPPVRPTPRRADDSAPAIPVIAEPVDVTQRALGAAALGAAYGVWPSFFLSFIALIAAGVWWGYAYFVQQRGMAKGPGMVIGAIAAIGAGLLTMMFGEVTTLMGMASGALCFGTATALLSREAGMVKALAPSIATAVVLGGLGIVWLGVSAPFTLNNKGGGNNGDGNKGEGETAAVKIEPNDLVFNGQQLENNRVTWQFQGHLKSNDGQVTGQMTWNPVGQKKSATMEVEGKFDGWRLELTGKSVSDPSLIRLVNYVLTLDDESNKLIGQPTDHPASLEGTVTHWPERKTPKFVPDGVVDEFVERFDGDLPPGQLPAGWKGDTTIGLVEQDGRRGLSPSGTGEHAFELPPLKLHGDFLFESTVVMPNRSDNTLFFTFRGSPGHPDLALAISWHRYSNEYVSIAGGEAKSFVGATVSTDRFRLEKRGDAFTFYQNGFLVHSVRLPKHVSFDGISGRVSGNAPIPILVGFRTSGLGPQPATTPESQEETVSLPYTETFATTALTKLPARWKGPPALGVSSISGTPVLGANVGGLHSAVSPPITISGDFTTEFDYQLERTADQLAEFTLLGGRSTPDLRVMIRIPRYDGGTFVQLDGTDAKRLPSVPLAATLSIKRTDDAFVVAINGTMLNTLRIPNAGSYRGVRVTLPGGEPLYLKGVRIYSGSQRPVAAATPNTPAAPSTPSPTSADKETKFVIKAALAKNLVSEQVTLTIGGQTFNWEVTEKKPSISLPISLKLEPGTYTYKVTGKSLVRLAPNRPGVSFTCEASGELTIAPDKIFTYVSDATVNLQEKTYQPEFR